MPQASLVIRIFLGFNLFGNLEDILVERMFLRNLFLFLILLFRTICLLRLAFTLYRGLLRIVLLEAIVSYTKIACLLAYLSACLPANACDFILVVLFYKGKNSNEHLLLWPVIGCLEQRPSYVCHTALLWCSLKWSS